MIGYQASCPDCKWFFGGLVRACPDHLLSACEACGLRLRADDCCPSCGVLHGEPCYGCGRRGYHRNECPLLDGLPDDTPYAG